MASARGEDALTLYLSLTWAMVALLAAVNALAYVPWIPPVKAWVFGNDGPDPYFVLVSSVFVPMLDIMILAVVALAKGWVVVGP